MSFGVQDLQYCAGEEFTAGTYYNWFVPNGKNSKEDTRCSYCIKNKIFTLPCSPLDNAPTSIFCDSSTDKTLTSICYHDLEIRVVALLSKEDTRPLYIVPTERDKTKNGLGIYIVPTNTHYKIIVKKSPNLSVDHSFTMKVKVGDKDVNINDGARIFYYRSTEITGMSTDSEDSFLFTAPTTQQSQNIEKLFNLVLIKQIVQEDHH